MRRVLIGIILVSIVLIVAMYVDVAQARTQREAIIDCNAHRDSEVVALACNIYHEARSESAPGQWLVALATRNRVENEHYPNTFAEVVWEARVDARTGKRVAMFSWTLDGKPDTVFNEERWLNALEIAARLVGEQTGILKTRVPDITYGCMWYHHIGISPYWVSAYYRTIRIQNHQCYAATEEAFIASIQLLVPELVLFQSKQDNQIVQN